MSVIISTSSSNTYNLYMAQTKLILIAHNIRSCHNVGSILRTADGIGVNKVYLTGYTPYPKLANGTRLPHLADRIEKQIEKTALGAQHSLQWEYSEDINPVIKQLQSSGITIAALEQSSESKNIDDFNPPKKLALIAGNELEGLDDATLLSSDYIIEIPMRGKKESFNVAIASAIALYQIAQKHKLV